LGKRKAVKKKRKFESELKKLFGKREMRNLAPDLPLKNKVGKGNLKWAKRLKPKKGGRNRREKGRDRGSPALETIKRRIRHLTHGGF